MIDNYECTGQMSIFDLTGQPVRITKPIRLIELFAGYGSQAMALKRVGARFEHYRVVEFDKYAVASYNAVHGTQFPPLDITQIHAPDLGICDTDTFTYLLTYSFPCTDLSVAGKQAGMSKGSGTRSGLLWEVERILCEIRDGGGELPQILFMENVPQVHGKKNMADFQKWIQFLESLGYTNFWKDLNAKDYGVAQNRNRCFMFSLLWNYTYRFPEPFPLTKKLKDYLEDDVEEKYYINNEKAEKLIKQLIDSGTLPNTDMNTCVDGTIKEQKKKTIARCVKAEMHDLGVVMAEVKVIGSLESKFESTNRIYDIGGVSPTLSTMQGGNQEPKIMVRMCGRNPDRPTDRTPGLQTEQRIEPNAQGIIGCLTSVQKDNMVLENLCVNDRGFLEKEPQISDGTAPTLRAETHCNLPKVVQKTRGFNEGGSHDLCPPNRYRIRKLTPRECGRLMDVSDEDITKMQAVNSNSQLYKQFGNSIVVAVMVEMFKNLSICQGKEEDGYED